MEMVLAELFGGWDCLLDSKHSHPCLKPQRAGIRGHSCVSDCTNSVLCSRAATSEGRAFGAFDRNFRHARDLGTSSIVHFAGSGGSQRRRHRTRVGNRLTRDAGRQHHRPMARNCGDGHLPRSIRKNPLDILHSALPPLNISISYRRIRDPSYSGLKKK